METLAFAADTTAVAHVFVDALDDEIVVDGRDGHHLARGRRVRVPARRVTVADGHGAWRPYVVGVVRGGSLSLEAIGGRGTSPARPDG